MFPPRSASTRGPGPDIPDMFSQTPLERRNAVTWSREAGLIMVSLEMCCVLCVYCCVMAPCVTGEVRATTEVRILTVVRAGVLRVAGVSVGPGSGG